MSAERLIMNKVNGSLANDIKQTRQLRRLGWQVLVVWECELKKPDKMLARLQKKLTAERADLTEKASHKRRA